MTVKLTAEFVRTVTCERCGAVEEIRYLSKGSDGSVAADANRIVQESSPRNASVRVLSASHGWDGCWRLSKGHKVGEGVEFDGDLCESCAETLLTFVRKFLADGIVGVVQLAKEEPAEPEIDIPF